MYAVKVINVPQCAVHIGHVTFGDTYSRASPSTCPVGLGTTWTALYGASTSSVRSTHEKQRKDDYDGMQDWQQALGKESGFKLLLL